MAKERAQYNGRKLAGTLPQEFSGSLKEHLRKFYPDKEFTSEFDEEFNRECGTDPADQFVSEILEAAKPAVSELFHAQVDLKTAELRREYYDLLEKLKAVEPRLRDISSDLDRLISNEADPLGCADKVKQLINFLEMASEKIEPMPKSDRKDKKEHNIALEMAVCVLRVLKDYGIPPAEYAPAEPNYSPSNAISILNAIWGDIAGSMTPNTWRGIIKEAKMQCLI